MQAPDFPPATSYHDELEQLELCIAQRADELLKQDGGLNPDRNFWMEAEREIWSALLASHEAEWISGKASCADGLRAIQS